MSETPETPERPARKPSEEMLDRYRKTAKLILDDRSERKLEFNIKAKATIQLMREVMPELDDLGIFTVFSSVAFMLSSLMMTPVAKISDNLEEMFDVYALASAALLGVTDLSDESPGPSKEEKQVRDLQDEIMELRKQLAADEGDDSTPGLYL